MGSFIIFKRQYNMNYRKNSCINLLKHFKNCVKILGLQTIQSVFKQYAFSYVPPICLGQLYEKKIDTVHNESRMNTLAGSPKLIEPTIKTHSLKINSKWLTTADDGHRHTLNQKYPQATNEEVMVSVIQTVPVLHGHIQKNLICYTPV